MILLDNFPLDPETISTILTDCKFGLYAFWGNLIVLALTFLLNFFENRYKNKLSMDFEKFKSDIDKEVAKQKNDLEKEINQQRKDLSLSFDSKIKELDLKVDKKYQIHDKREDQLFKLVEMLEKIHSYKAMITSYMVSIIFRPNIERIHTEIENSRLAISSLFHGIILCTINDKSIKNLNSQIKIIDDYSFKLHGYVSKVLSTMNEIESKELGYTDYALKMLERNKELVNEFSNEANAFEGARTVVYNVINAYYESIIQGLDNQVN